jgi:hypothetical protein
LVEVKLSGLLSKLSLVQQFVAALLPTGPVVVFETSHGELHHVVDHVERADHLVLSQCKLQVGLLALE